MNTVEFFNQKPDYSAVKYSVIVARYRNQWVFCRHRERETWEIPGGHLESGETPEEAACRELYEETGALEADIRPICYYRCSELGMLYYADIQKLGSLPPSSEMAEIRLLDSLPVNLTYPHIQPALFHRVQGWLNIQSGAGEIWDVYDQNRKLTGRTHRRGEPLAEGDYHLVVHVWMQNSSGQFLLTKRSPNKGFPNMWETTGGSALSGDDSLTAALREVREETGLTLNPAAGNCLLSLVGSDYLTDVWLFRHDCRPEDVTLQEGETCGVMLAEKSEILRLQKDGLLVPYSYLTDFFAFC